MITDYKQYREELLQFTEYLKHKLESPYLSDEFLDSMQNENPMMFYHNHTDGKPFHFKFSIVNMNYPSKQNKPQAD